MSHQNESRRILSFFILIAILLVSEAADINRRCHVPTITERVKGRKSAQDIIKVSKQSFQPIAEYTCTFFNFWRDSRCFLDTCPKWAGDKEVETGRELDFANRLKRILSESLVGQEAAIDLIVSAFRSKKSDEPLSMHLVGDNGTGKTLAGKLISNAIFKAEHPTGALYIRGNSYIASESTHTSAFRRGIKDMIEKQLKQCPGSLIVVDELQLMHRHTIVVFDQFLDTTFRADYLANGGVDTSQATFIFISDFGKEGSSINDKPEELVQRAYDESVSIWKGSRTSSLIQTIVPFMPASPRGVFELVSKMTYELLSHDYFKRNHLRLTSINFCDQDQLAHGISKLVWETMQSGVSKLEQYRGIRKVFEQLVVRQIVDSASVFQDSNKLWRVPRTEPEIDVSLTLCTNGGTSPLSVALELPWCSDDPKTTPSERTEVKEDL